MTMGLDLISFYFNSSYLQRVQDYFSYISKISGACGVNTRVFSESETTGIVGDTGSDDIILDKENK